LSLHLFSFSATPTPEISTLSLHDAFRSQQGQSGFGPLPLGDGDRPVHGMQRRRVDALQHRVEIRDFPPACLPEGRGEAMLGGDRSEEHTSELQSLAYLVCRLLLEKKNT